jgi:hypothetical protein
LNHFTVPVAIHLPLLEKSGWGARTLFEFQDRVRTVPVQRTSLKPNTHTLSRAFARGSQV